MKHKRESITYMLDNKRTELRWNTWMFGLGIEIWKAPDWCTFRYTLHLHFAFAHLTHFFAWRPARYPIPEVEKKAFGI